MTVHVKDLPITHPPIKLLVSDIYDILLHTYEG